jgi:D-tyrosyl-tRNA(Tyr) deacylase
VGTAHRVLYPAVHSDQLSSGYLPSVSVHYIGRLVLYRLGLVMRVVVQRVSSASVVVAEETVGEINRGFLILLGIAEDDTQDDIIWLAAKIAALRVFEDEGGKMNLNLKQIAGSALVVSQFTLMGDCRKGRRPSFITAARPELANSLYQSFVAELKGLGIPVQTGTFQAHMDVSLVNDGPVTLLLDSRKSF